jgi:hypothetical protein
VRPQAAFSRSNFTVAASFSFPGLFCVARAPSELLVLSSLAKRRQAYILIRFPLVPKIQYPVRYFWFERHASSSDCCCCPVSALIFPACLFSLCCRAPGTFLWSAFPLFSAALAFGSALPHPACFLHSSRVKAS